MCPSFSGNKYSANDGRPISRCSAPSSLLGVVLPYFHPYTRSYAKVSIKGEGRGEGITAYPDLINLKDLYESVQSR